MDITTVVQYFQGNPWLLAAVITWGVLWKGIALWYAARNSQLAWYIILVIVNTLGILEIIYLLFFRRRRPWF
ncbi:MAG: DUF5652 family protein [Desulfotomaculaceae bacterium]|nr:DUF5652 family protein [Desulfotomaculaceae bacterium]MDD4766491.1 DUF5652 family protein [Desulfotomaculaceae bacterium]